MQKVQTHKKEGTQITASPLLFCEGGLRSPSMIYPIFALNASVNAGTYLNKSPTMP